MTSLETTATAVTTTSQIARRAEPSGRSAAMVEYLGQWQMPRGASADGVRIGGLSGISYDPQRELYYVISDDMSGPCPGRFHTVRIPLSGQGLGEVQFTSTHALLDKSGRPFRPNNFSITPPIVAPDAEAIAYDSVRQRLYWTSEGYDTPATDEHPAILVDPWIRIATLDGSYQGEFTLPPNLLRSPDAASGPRVNAALEGLSVTPDGKFLFAAMEQPLYQDGPAANANRDALIRVTKFDVETRRAVAQFAYRVERSTQLTKVNGVSDILALSETAFLIVERAIHLPHLAVSVYWTDASSATDVLEMSSLRGRPVTPMTKKLAVNLNTQRDVKQLDNIEGITLGPSLPDGRQSIVLISDDNFLPFQVTQFLVFAM